MYQGSSEYLVVTHDSTDETDYIETSHIVILLIKILFWRVGQSV